MMEIAKTLDYYEKSIETGKRSGLMGAIQIGSALRKINEDNLWAVSGAKSFNAYVSGAHGISKSTCYNLIGISMCFGPALLTDPSLQSVDVTRLIRLLPHVTPDNADELLHSAAQIPGAQAFEDTLRNLQGKVGSDDDHIHDFQPVNIQQCKICGLRRKI